MPDHGPDQFATLAGGTRVCFRTDGQHGDPSVLLIGGLAEDLTMWSQKFIQLLAHAGLFVIRMDNRDCGRSTSAAIPAPGTLRQLLARPRSDAYTLTDMAADSAQLIDHLGIGPAHLVGRSMGGMIAQTIAARFPTRTATLTSIYATTGNPKVGQPTRSTKALLVSPPPKTRVQAVRAHLRMTAHLAGAGYPVDEVEETAHAVESWNRTAGDPAAGTARQIQAIQASGDRTAELAGISAPTLIINGDHDRIVAPSGGDATAAAITGARHLVIPGMGHHLPDSLAQNLAEHIVEHIAASSRTSAERKLT